MKRKYETGGTAKPVRPNSYKIDIPFTPDELSRFRAFVKAHGKSRGPWVRIAVIKAMDTEERIFSEAENAC